MLEEVKRMQRAKRLAYQPIAASFDIALASNGLAKIIFNIPLLFFFSSKHNYKWILNVAGDDDEVAQICLDI
ncbi:hypothetical protein MANES_12G072000v8 [Manihot esculenta]|uniref:Uncharacterized protein n=1 Tax=Manihot esculenta TaxID=3983 RepID=A0A2C9UVU1_MANES|nr:hypothetical protein MANES_12G072000v8 [Manihot esculenta]